MPRTLNDAKVESRASRTRLKIGRDHWKTLEPARLHLGYRRKTKDQAGLWLARRYKGGERYQLAPLGLADDLQDARPGILSYAEAARAAHAHIWDGPARRRVGGPTVGDVIENYIAFLKQHRATARDASIRARAWILPRLGAKRVSELTSADISGWLEWVAESPAMVRGGHKKEKPRATDEEAMRARRATANRVLTTLKGALNYAFREDKHVNDDTAWRRVTP